MGLYRKLPVTIEAFQWTGDADQTEDPQWFTSALGMQVEILNKGTPQLQLQISTLEGPMTAIHGDWIIKGVKGELYPCKPDIFEMTYEPAPEQT